MSIGQILLDLGSKVAKAALVGLAEKKKPCKKCPHKRRRYGRKQ